MKYVSIDVETTGNDPSKDEIIEFAAVVDDTDWFLRPQYAKPVEELPSFQTYIIKRSNRYKGVPVVLAMHTLIWERIHNRTEGYTYLNRYEVASCFADFLLSNGFDLNDKNQIWFNAAGKNYAGFDQQFIEKHFDGWTDMLRNNRRVLDPAILYYQDGDEKLPDTATCIERAGLSDPVNHEALSDAQTVIRLIRKKL